MYGITPFISFTVYKEEQIAFYTV